MPEPANLPEEPEWDSTVPETSEVPEVQIPPATSPVLEYMKGRGYKVDEYESDDQVLESLEKGYAQVQKYSPVVSEYLRDQEEYRQWKEQRQQKPPEQPETQTPEVKVPSWQAPTISERAKRFYMEGEFEANPRTGFLTAKEPALQKFADEYNNANQWRQDRAEKFWENPLALLKEAGLEEELKQLRESLSVPDVKSLREEIKREIFEELAKTSTISQVEKTLSDDAAFLFKTNEQGEVLFNAAGEPIRNELGDKYREAVDYAEAKYGITDPVKKHEFAYEFLAPALVEARAKSEEQQNKTPAQKRKEKQDTFLEKAARDGKAKSRLEPGDATIQSAAVREANDVVTEDSLWAKSRQEALAELV